MTLPAQRPTYYPALDGFRAVAVLMVFSTHYMGISLPFFRNWGWMGVDFFFVLSGFLITGILWDSRERTHRFRDFYARRILRIFPLYYGVWIALLLFWPVFRWQWNREWLLWPLHLGNLARFLFFDPANMIHLDILFSGKFRHLLGAAYIGHFWSLCVEEQFYLVWPMVVLFARSRRMLIAISASIVVLEPFLRLFLYHHLSPDLLQAEFLYRFTLTRLDALVLGGLVALLLRGPAGAMLHRYGRLLSFTSVALFVWMIADYIHRNHTSFSVLGDKNLSTFGFTAIDLLAAGVILELIRAESPLARLAQWTPLRRLGQISYGFYVFHDIPHDIYNHLAGPFGHYQHPAAAVIGLICTIALSMLSYRFYEAPFLRFKSHFASQTHTAPEA